MSLRLIFMYLFTPVACVFGVFRPFIGLCLLVAMHYFRPEIFDAPDWFRPQLWITIAVGVGWLVERRPKRFSAPLVLAWLIVGTFFATHFTAVDDVKIAFDGSTVLLKLVIVMMFTVSLVDTPERMNWFLWSNVVGMIYNLKAIYIEAFRGGEIKERADVGIGQGGGANYIAMILAMSLPFLYMRALNARGRERQAALILTPIYVVALVLTGSRAGMLALVVTGLYLLVRSNKRAAGAVMMAGLTVLFFVVVPQSFLDRFKEGIAISGEVRDNSASTRLQLWKTAVRMFDDHPVVGVGFDNFQLMSPRYVGFYAGKSAEPYQPGVRGRGFVAHSTWFQTLAEGGMLATLPLFALLGIAMLGLRRAGRLDLPADVQTVHRQQAVAVTGAMIAMLVTSCFGSHIRVDFFWWYIGAASAVWLNASAARRAALRQLQADALRLRRAAADAQRPLALAPGAAQG